MWPRWFVAKGLGGLLCSCDRCNIALVEFDRATVPIERPLKLSNRSQTFLPVSGRYIDRRRFQREVSGSLKADAIVAPLHEDQPSLVDLVH